MKTRFFKVAQSGNTVDGRQITPAQIDQMAKNYDPAKYGARVNLEHYLSYLPDGVFKAYGDVLALKSEAGPEGSRVLLAQIDATTDLVKLNESRQKVYWSIELNPNFAGTGEAYMMGLAMTDTPASLGTEILTFALSSDKAPAEAKSRLYSTALEGSKDDMADDKPKDDGPSHLLSKVKELLTGDKGKADARFAQLEQALETIAAEVGTLRQGQGAGSFASTEAVTKLSTDLAALKTELGALVTKLSQTDDKPPRPQAGGTDTNLTDC